MEIINTENYVALLDDENGSASEVVWFLYLHYG